MKVSISLPAANFIRRMIRFNGSGAEAGFRLVVKPGGCSGLSYDFSVESAPLAGDIVVRQDDIRLFVPESCAHLLDGAIVGFEDSMTQTRLVFINPNLPNSCGGACSSSAAASVVSVVRRPV